LSYKLFSDDRKEKQIKVALEAKNDTLDKLEVDKRQIWLNYRIYNKYLQQVFLNQLRETEHLEITYQDIKKVTVSIIILIQGMSNLKTIIEKVQNRHKNYNFNLAKVGELTKTLEEKNQDLKILKENKTLLNNEGK